MRWGKIIPVIMFLVLILAGVSYAWQEAVIVCMPRVDIRQVDYIDAGRIDSISFTAIHAILEPLAPVSCAIEKIAISYQQALKSA